MPDYLKPDLCIIGAGSAGLSVAAAARAFDASVVLIERARMGGDCLNAGCVPSKSLIAAGKLAHAMRQASRFGLTDTEPKPNFRAIEAHVTDVVSTIAPHDSVERFRALGAEVITAEARFLDKRTVLAGDQHIRARRFVIATGSRPAIPDIPGLAEVPYFTNETIFSNQRKLTHLVIIGGGPVALELGQTFRRLGSEVTILDNGKALSRTDPELAETVFRALRAEGVDLREDTAVTRIQPRSMGIGVLTTRSDGTTETLDASHILVATGRTTNVDGLDIDKARIRRDGKDPRKLWVKPNLKTSNRRVYAIGDAAGGQMFTHAAGYHAGLVVRSALFGLPVRNQPHLVPRAVYTSPEIAEVGLTEAEVKARHGTRYRVLRTSLADNDRKRAERDTDGHARLLTDLKGRILGAGIVGGHAGETIALFSFAIANGLTIKPFLNFIAAYPTESELAKRLATEFYREQTGHPVLAALRSLVRLLP